MRAGDGIRTHEYQLGRLMPYHLATPACEQNFTTIERTILCHGFYEFSRVEIKKIRVNHVICG